MSVYADEVRDFLDEHDRTHRTLTLGSERYGLRVARGRLDRRGKWHGNRPDVFLLWRGRRIG